MILQMTFVLKNLLRYDWILPGIEKFSEKHQLFGHIINVFQRQFCYATGLWWKWQSMRQVRESETVWKLWQPNKEADGLFCAQTCSSFFLQVVKEIHV